MRVEVVETAQALALRAADIVCDLVRGNPAAVLGLASGRTPLGLYRELARRLQAGEADLSAVTAFAIDELLGVPREHPATNASYFRRELTERVPLRALHVMDSQAVDPDTECLLFERLIEGAGGIDLALVGIGRNGHLAFNEPGSPFDSRTRHVELTPSSREQYAPLFGSLDATPAYGLTLGIADLLSARAVLLLASGANKAEAVARALEEPPSEALPASVLQRHPNATALLDREAAARLRQAAS
jgi:glucosamine-6-phosphate deaminase